MKKTILRLIALILCCLLLTGCSTDYSRYINALRGTGSSGSVTTFSDMVYTRPDMEKMESVLAEAIEAAAGEDFNLIIDKIYEFYDIYDDFYTNYSLADIHYSADLTNTYWEAETNFCAENSSRVDAALEELYYALAKSPCLEKLEGPRYFGDGYFDSYQGDNPWDEEFTALLEEESRLISRYYELSRIGSDYRPGSEAFYDNCGYEMAQLLVELIQLRHRIADYWGYDDYTQFATDFYYYRDYTSDQSRTYLEDIKNELVPLYRQLNNSGFWDSGYDRTTEADTFRYVQVMATAMGGMVKEAFDLMDQADLYDISRGANKFPSSFEVYLTTYQEPFIFVCPSGTTYDHLTFAHEFGHFCSDYAAGGSYAGIDVLEIFSQGMEYLSLCYVEDTEDLTRLKMADGLCIYVEQSAFASFEMQMYEIPPEELTTEALFDLYDRVAMDYGLDSVGYDPREFVTISHYYTNPMYVISYVVSNDAALQLYQMERNQPGAGLTCFEENLATEEYYFLAFLESAGLESPFAPGRIQSVRKTFEEILG